MQRRATENTFLHRLRSSGCSAQRLFEQGKHSSEGLLLLNFVMLVQLALLLQ